MTYEDAARLFKIKPKVLRTLLRKNILFSTAQLTGEEITMLKGIVPIWGSEYFLRIQLAEFSKKRRQELIRRVGLTKPESFMYNRFLKAKLAEPPQELSVHQVASEAMLFLQIPDKEKITLKMVGIARKMRQKAYYEIRKLRREEFSSESL